MNKIGTEKWDYYYDGVEYTVTLRDGEKDGSDDIAVAYSERDAKLIAAAPDMYNVLWFILKSDDIDWHKTLILNCARELLSRIDGEQESKS